ncbi:MAG TPA: hypothetical protein VJJ55_01400 [Candidatus Paceibacterota bacterium]
MPPQYDLDKLKFATDGPTFEKAVALYEGGKVKDFRQDPFGYSARIRGSEPTPYEVSVSAKHYDRGACTCYLGREDILCKHMVAVALYALKRGDKLTEDEKRLVSEPVSSGKVGELGRAELSEIKRAVSAAMRCIKSYDGPSHTWFAYQNSLSEGCNRLSKIVSELPVGVSTARMLIELLLRLDEKLSRGGVDDSDGTVGGFVEETVAVLQDYAKLVPECKKEFETLKNRETCFGWEEPMVKLL